MHGLCFLPVLHYIGIGLKSRTVCWHSLNNGPVWQNIIWNSDFFLPGSSTTFLSSSTHTELGHPQSSFLDNPYSDIACDGPYFFYIFTMHANIIFRVTSENIMLLYLSMYHVLSFFATHFFSLLQKVVIPSSDIRL